MIPRIVAAAFLLLLVAAVPGVYHHRSVLPFDLARLMSEGRGLPMRPDCVETHPDDPGLCVRAPGFVRTVDWLRGHFPPGRAPVVYSDDTLRRIELRYYTHLGWGGHRDASCVVYYSESAAWLDAVRALPRSVPIDANSVLELPPSAGWPVGDGGLDDAVARCRAIGDGEPVDPLIRQAPEAILARCAGVSAGSAGPIENLGLGGIEITSRRMGDAVVVRALFIGVANHIESIAVSLVDAAGNRIASVTENELVIFSHEREIEFPLTAGGPPPTAEACMVDSEGFAIRAALPGLGG